MKVRLDDQPMRLKTDVRWDTPGAMEATDRYDLTVYSGCVRVTLDTAAPVAPGAAPSVASGAGGASTWRADQGLSLVLDGIEQRLRDHRTS